jgi:uncharacterized protein (TIGR03435 family)
MRYTAVFGVLTFWLACAAYGQTVAAPEFEVASVRPSALGGLIFNHTPTLDVEPGHNLQFQNVLLRDLITLAYGVGLREIVAPTWLHDPAGESNDSPRFNIIAKVPADASKAQIPLMLRKLLAERFKLELHHEQRELQVFAMEVAKGGPKLQEAAAGRGDPGCSRGMLTKPELRIVAACRGVSTADLAQQLQTLAPGYFGDAAIVNKTGLTGVYDLDLEWIRIQEANAGVGGPTIFTSLQKLGLRLDKRREAVDVLVIDHCEKLPTDN